MKRRIYGLALLIFFVFSFISGCATQVDLDDTELSNATIGTITETKTTTAPETESDSEFQVNEGEFYYSAEDVAAYLRTFGALPPNYITKEEATELGWDSSKGNLWDVADGYVIGGNRFGNREGLLPDAKGRKWFECDVDYEGGYRNERRLVYSDDGLIYFTDDHYSSFEDWSDN